MEWSLDKNRAWTREIWPSEAAGALGTAAAAKAPRGRVVFQNKVCLGSPIEVQHRGACRRLQRVL